MSAAPGERPGAALGAWSLASLLAAALVAAWLRGRGLGEFSITHWDEGLAWRGALWFGSLGAEGHYSPSHAPPLLPLLFALVHWLGGGPAQAVWVDVGLSLAALPLAWLLGRELSGERAGQAAAWLLALSGLHVGFARSLLTESLYVALLLATLLASARALRVGRWSAFALTGACAAALQLTKYNGFLAAVPLAIVLAIDLARERPGAGRRRVAARLAALVGPPLFAIALNVGALAAAGRLDEFVTHFRGYVGRSEATPARVFGTLLWVAPSAWLALGALGIVWTATRRMERRLFLFHATFALYLAFVFRYPLYLRLLLPVVTLLWIYAALGFEGLSRLRPRALGIVLAAAGLAVGVVQSARTLDRHLQSGYGGYHRAVAWLAKADPSLPVLCHTQEFVWAGLEPPPTVAELPSERAWKAIEGASEVILVLDVGAFSRLRPWDLTELHAALEPWRAARVANPLGLDVLQNNLTLQELRRFEHDAEFAGRVGSIHIYRLPAGELRGLVARHARLRGAADA